MERKRNPSEKKALDYRVQHRYVGEYVQRELRSWPKKKQLRNQTYRRRVERSLDRALNKAGVEMEDVSPAPVRRIKSRRYVWGPVPLGEWVAGKLSRRVERTAWNYFKEPYDSQRHRKTFSAILASLTKGRSAHSRALAERFAGLLAGIDPELLKEGRYVLTGAPHYAVARGRQVNTWLQAFFRDEPEWEPRLRAWIIEMVS